MKRTLFRLLVLSGIGYILLCAFLYLYQDNLLYFPQARVVTEKSNTLLLPTEVGHTVVTVAKREGAKALIYFGGNAEDVSRRLDKFKSTFPDYSLYLMHYRGYGGSHGQPDEQLNYQDAQALFEQVAQSKRKIVLMGYSLGSGIATRLAAEKSPDSLILVTPYSSIEDLASERYWGFPVSLLLQDKYLSWQYAARVTAKTSILLAGQDRVIPEASTLKLMANFPEGVATLHRFDDDDHGSIISSQRYFDLLAKLTK